MAGIILRTETGGVMDGKIEELKKEKRTLKTSITKLLNELAAELLTKTPNKENVMAKLQDIDKRWDELLELLDSLQICTEKISIHCWQLQQVMKRIK